MNRPNLHRLAEERSLALHGAIAERLAERPELVDEARRRVERWIATGEVAAFYALAWRDILGGSLQSIAHALLDASERARALRQVTPFSGVIDPRTRWKIWRDVREKMERA